MIHFETRPDEEFMCDDREELIEMLQQEYQAILDKPLKVFALGSAYLYDYLTTEEDLFNNQCRMPTEEYLIDETGSNTRNQENPQADESPFAMAPEAVIDNSFVVIDLPRNEPEVQVEELGRIS